MVGADSYRYVQNKNGFEYAFVNAGRAGSGMRIVYLVDSLKSPREWGSDIEYRCGCAKLYKIEEEC